MSQDFWDACKMVSLRAGPLVFNLAGDDSEISSLRRIRAAALECLATLQPVFCPDFVEPLPLVGEAVLVDEEECSYQLEFAAASLAVVVSVAGGAELLAQTGAVGCYDLSLHELDEAEH